MKRNFSIVQLFFVFLLSGCFSKFEKKSEDSKILTHIVLCWLKDPGNLEHRKKIIEITDSFNEIPSVINARAGNPIMSERSIVDDSFDVGILIVTKDQTDLRKYLDHPKHVIAKEKILMPIIRKILVYDFIKVEDD